MDFYASRQLRLCRLQVNALFFICKDSYGKGCLNMKINLSVRFRIVFAVIIIPVILITVFSLVLYNSTFQQVYQGEQKNLEALAQVIGEKIYVAFAQKYQVLQSLRNDRVIIESIAQIPPDSLDYEVVRENVLAYDAVRDRLTDITTGTPIDLLYVASEDSRMFLSDREPALPDWYDSRQRPRYTGAIAKYREFISGASSEQRISGGDITSGERNSLYFVSPPYPTAEEGAAQAFAITAAAVIEQNNVPVGVAALDYDIEELDQIGKALAVQYQVLITFYISDSAFEFYSASTGFQDPSLPENDLRNLGMALGYEDEELDEVITGLTSGQPFYFEGNTESDGVSMIQSTPILGTPFSIIVGQPLSRVTTETRAAVLPPVVIGTVLFIVLQLLGAFYVGRSVFRPLRLLTETIDELSRGTGDLTSRIPVYRNDEFGKISKGFNEFVEKLQGIVISIKDSTGVVSAQKDELLSNTEESASASAEITANVDSVRSQITNLDGQIQSVSSAMDEIQATVLSLNSNTDTQKRAVDQATASIEQMVASLRSVASIVQAKRDAASELQQVIEDAGSKVNDAAQAYNEVVQLAARISEMSEVIQNIASQTNLLSMNAAIEAAHAGEAGRGFAVVADEIRKLAEIAQTNSTQITEVVTEITEKVDVAASVANNSSKAFEQVKNETSSTIQALDEINSSTQELSEGGEQIIQANQALNEVSSSVQQSAKEMQSTVSMVTSSTSEIADISRSVNSAMSEISTGINEVSISSEHIRTISQKLSHTAVKLIEETGKFKTEGSAEGREGAVGELSPVGEGDSGESAQAE
jgi:methyl-accepting chemotaxis protein